MNQLICVELKNRLKPVMIAVNHAFSIGEGQPTYSHERVMKSKYTRSQQKIITLTPAKTKETRH